jgi:chemotaxis protein methyltransferase CheR
MVQFREQNILEDLVRLGSFDIVFCRNVLIYFDTDTKKEVLKRIARSLASEGVLFLGGTETVIGITDHFEPVPGHRGIYRATTRSSTPTRTSNKPANGSARMLPC